MHFNALVSCVKKLKAVMNNKLQGNLIDAYLNHTDFGEQIR